MKRNQLYRQSGNYDRNNRTERSTAVGGVPGQNPRSGRSTQINQLMAELDKEEMAKRRFVNMTFENRESLITSISAWRRNVCAILTLQGEFAVMSRDEYTQAVINCLKQSDIIPITRSENLLAKFLLELLLNESYSQDTILGAARVLELNRRIEDLEQECQSLKNECGNVANELAHIIELDQELLVLLVKAKYQSKIKYLEERIIETKIKMTTNKYQNNIGKTMAGRKPSVLSKFNSKKVLTDDLNSLKEYNDLNELYNSILIENTKLKQQLEENDISRTENEFNQIISGKNTEISRLEIEIAELNSKLVLQHDELSEIIDNKPKPKSLTSEIKGNSNDDLSSIYSMFHVDPNSPDRMDQMEAIKNNLKEIKIQNDMNSNELKNIYALHNVDFNSKKRYDIVKKKLYNNDEQSEQEYIDRILELYNLHADSTNKYNVIYNNIIDMINKNKELNRMLDSLNKDTERLCKNCDININENSRISDRIKLIEDFFQEREDSIQNLVEIVFTEDNEGTLDDIVEKVRQIADLNSKLDRDNKRLMKDNQNYKNMIDSKDKSKLSQNAEYLALLNNYNEILDTIDCTDMDHKSVIDTLNQMKNDLDVGTLKNICKLLNIKPSTNNRNNLDLIETKIEELLRNQTGKKGNLDDIDRIDDTLNKIYETIDAKPFENRADGIDYIYVYINNLEEDSEYDDYDDNKSREKENDDHDIHNRNIIRNKILYELREFRSNLTDIKSVTAEEEEEPTTEEEYIKIIKTILFKMDRNTKYLIDNYDKIPLNIDPSSEDSLEMSLLKTANHELELQINQLIEDKILKDDQLSTLLLYLNLPEQSTPNQILSKITNLQNSIIDGPTILKINSDLENKYKNLLVQFIYLKKLYNTIKQTCYYSVDKNIIDIIESKVPFNKDSILNAYFTSVNPQSVNWKKSSTDPNCLYNQHKDGWTSYHLLQYFQSIKLKFTSKQINHMFVELDENHSGLLEYNEFVHINKYIEFKNDLLSKFSEVDKEKRIYLQTNVIKELLFSLGLGRLYELAIKQAVILNNLINYETFTKLCLQISLLIDFTPAN